MATSIDRISNVKQVEDIPGPGVIESNIDFGKIGSSNPFLNEIVDQYGQKQYVDFSGRNKLGEVVIEAPAGATAPTVSSTAGPAGSISPSMPSATEIAQRQSWITAGKQMLQSYNLGKLGDKYVALLTDPNLGYNQQTALLALQQEPEWKTRFSGNASRIAAGMQPLQPAAYLAAEDTYRQLFQSAGLNAFANNQDILGGLIAKDVSPLEAQQRINAANLALNNIDPFVTQQLQQEFGLTKSDMVAHILAPDVAAPIIQQKAEAAKIGAEASRQGVASANALALAQQGVTQDQAARGYYQIAQQLTPEQTLAARFQGQSAAAGTMGSLEAAQFGTAGGAKAAVQKVKLAQMEENLFQGTSGIDKSSLMQGTQGTI
jgi:hypothetical protein